MTESSSAEFAGQQQYVIVIHYCILSVAGSREELCEASSRSQEAPYPYRCGGGR